MSRRNRSKIVSRNNLLILPVHQLVRARVADDRRPSVQPAAPTIRRFAEMSLETPPSRALGDSRSRSPLRSPAACARRRAPSPRSSPAALGPIDGVARVEAAPNGYLNFFLDRAYWVQQWLRPPDGGRTAPAGRGGKTIVEHTAINPNKAAHIGHLRNATLGDAFGRLLRFQGRPVEIQNYIDDTGVQVADVVVGFRELERKIARRRARHRRLDALRLLLLGSLRQGHRVVRGGQGAPEDPQRRAARHRARRQRDRRDGRLHRRSHRPLPSEDDGAG